MNTLENRNEYPTHDTKYFIVCRGTHDELSRAVHYYMHLKISYVPIGGVAVGHRPDHSGTWFYQAMVRQ